MLRYVPSTTTLSPLLGYQWGAPPFGPTTQDSAATHALLQAASQKHPVFPCHAFEELPGNFPLPLLFLDPSTYPPWKMRPEAQRPFEDLEREYLERMQDYERSILGVIPRGGAVPFDDFFNITNYGSQGVYTTGDAAQRLFTNTPRSDDISGGYFNTASHYPQFAEAFVKYAFQQWELAGNPDEFTFCEMGAGNGSFAEHFIKAVQRFSESSENWRRFSKALRYHIVEMSKALIDYQRRRLQPLSSQVSFTQSNAYADNLPHIRIGIFFSNELLDMFPPRQVIHHDDRLEEVFILNGGCLLHKIGMPLREDSLDFLRTFNIEIPKNRGLYIQPDIPRHIATMRRHLEDGTIIVCDYGQDRSELLELHQKSCRRYFSPETTFLLPENLARHPLNISFPGDMTVDVDFTLLKAAFLALGFNVSAQPQTLFIKNQTGHRWVDDNLQSLSEGCSVFIAQ